MIDTLRWKSVLASASRTSVHSEISERMGAFVMAAAVGLFALAALFAPLDAARLVTGDPLYVVQMLDFGLLDYRPPLSNRWVPDGLLHLALSPLRLPLAEQMIAVGVVIFLATSLATYATRGDAALALYLLVLATARFDFISSIDHYALPLGVLVYLWSRDGRFEPLALFVVVFSNPLILFPLALAFVEEGRLRPWLIRTAVVAMAVAANTIYTEFSPALALLVLALPVWLAGAWLATRLGLREWFLLALLAGLPVAAILGIVPSRYGVPIAACVPVLLFPWQPRRLGWQPLAVSAVIVTMALATIDWSRHDRLTADYDCLVDELGRRGIATVATDHWNAKPLYFAAKAKGARIGIVQTRFDDGSVHSIMAPYDFYGEPTRWAVRGADSCTVSASWNPIFCGQPDIAPVVSSQPLCRNFELYEYTTELPLGGEGRPAGKLAAGWRNFEVYLARFGRLVGL